MISGRNEEAGHALADDLRSHGADAEFIGAGVRNDDHVRNLVDRTVERFGRLDGAAYVARWRDSGRLSAVTFDRRPNPVSRTYENA